MRTQPTPTAIIVPQPEPPSASELRAAYLRQRHQLAPAVAAVLAEMMLAPSASWAGRRA